MAIPNPITAIARVLAENADIAALTGSPADAQGRWSRRVFTGELPAALAAAGVMPVPTILVTAAGQSPRSGGPSYLPLAYPLLDIHCYAQTLGRAMALYLAVDEELETLRRRVSGAGPASTLIHSAWLSAGPMQLREPESDWPVVWASYTVLVSKVPVP